MTWQDFIREALSRIQIQNAHIIKLLSKNKDEYDEITRIIDESVDYVMQIAEEADNNERGNNI